MPHSMALCITLPVTLFGNLKSNHFVLINENWTPSVVGFRTQTPWLAHNGLITPSNSAHWEMYRVRTLFSGNKKPAEAGSFLTIQHPVDAS